MGEAELGASGCKEPNITAMHIHNFTFTFTLLPIKKGVLNTPFYQF